MSVQQTVCLPTVSHGSDYSETQILHFCGDHVKLYKIWEALFRQDWA